MIKTSKQIRRYPSYNQRGQVQNQNLKQTPQKLQQTINSNPQIKFTESTTKNPDKKISEIMNGPSEKTFMKYYEDNIRLRKELEDKNSYIQELRKKIEQQNNLSKTTNPYAQLQQLKQEVKKSGPTRGQSAKGKTFYNTMTGSGETKKIENLLEIIESYKHKVMIAQEESANLRRQKTLMQQDLRLNSKPHKQHSFLQSSHPQDLRKDEQLLTRLRQKTSECELQRQRGKFMQAQLRRLQNKMRTLEMDSDQMEELKVENRILQERIMKLTSMSDNSQGFDRRGVEDKNRELETKLKAGIEKYSKLKEQKTRVQIDYKLMQNKLIEIQHQLQSTQRQNLQLKKNQINDPVIQRLILNKELLVQVIGEIEKPKTKSQPQGVAPFQSKQKLLLEKESLAKELLDVKNKVKNMEEAWKEKETMIKLQKEEMLAHINLLPVTTDKNAKYTSKQGVQYDGDIAMFSDEKIGTKIGVNFFDLYLGQLNLIQTLVKSVSNISSINNPLIMATVDFYNFPTQNTKLSQGLNSNLNTEFVFKLSEDEFFYKFMSKGTFRISIWAAEGNKNHHLGVVEVPLKQLVMKNRPNISPVVNTSAPIVLAQKVIGTLFFDMRMRLPIYEQAAHILSQPINTNQKQENAPKRKLIIQIEEGNGFSPNSNIFVYYPFRLQDFYTKTSKGPQPKWSHHKMIDVLYNEDFKNYLRKNQLQFTLFDDNAVLYDEKDTDVVGNASLPLMTLVDLASSDKPIREKLQIKKNGMKVGVIDVKVFWYQNKQKLQNKQIKKKQELIETIHNDIIKYINDIGSSAERQFKKIDFNGTGMISFDEFLIWITKVKQTHKYSSDFISKYYDTFNQPLNRINWVNRLSHHQSEEQKRQVDLMPQLGMINQMLKKNSVQINNQVSLQEYLKDKRIFDVSLDIDTDRNGMITKQELIKYMKDHNVVFNEKEIEGDKISLKEFLGKYGN